jgi:hypothetical protein
MKANNTHNNPLTAASKWLRGTVATPNQDGLLDRTLQARRDGIHEEPLGDKLILFDSSTRRSVSLDAAAAFVWKRCDGGTSVAEIAAAYGRGEAEVLRALSVLAEAGLLLEEISIPSGHSRRNFLTYGGRAAGLALIGSLIAAPRSLAGGKGKGLGHQKDKGKGHDSHGNGNGYGHDKYDPVDCGGVWGPYSTCSVSCGGGAQVRTFTVLTAAANGGAACPVSPETQECNTQACQALPVDCTGQYSAWSPCSLTCGEGGIRSRTFTVDTPDSNGGTPCPPDLTEPCIGVLVCQVYCNDCGRSSDKCETDGTCTHLCPLETDGQGCCMDNGDGTWFNDC